MSLTVSSLRQPVALDGLEEATVDAVSESGVLVTSTQGIERANRAFSCLVAPCVGDTVLVSRIAPSRLYIIAILERTAESGRDVSMDFDGSLTLSSTQDVTIVSKRTRLVGQQLDLTGGEVAISAKNLQSYADSTVLSSNKFRLLTHTLDVVSERLTRHVKDLVSMVSGHEVRKAGHLTEQVSEFKLEQSKNSIIDVRKDLKMDAERIHMG